MTRDSSDGWNRRAVLGSVARGAVGATTLASAASAASSDELAASADEVDADRTVESFAEIESHCWGCTTYNECRDSCYVGSGVWSEELYQQTCCICDGDTVCSNWEATGDCCPES